jgi:hypothetical protein
MDNSADGFDHGHGVLILPDVSTQIHTYGAFLEAVINKLKYFVSCRHLGPAGNDYRNGAALGNLLEFFTVIGLDHSSAQLSSDTT